MDTATCDSRMTSLFKIHAKKCSLVGKAERTAHENTAGPSVKENFTRCHINLVLLCVCGGGGGGDLLEWENDITACKTLARVTISALKKKAITVEQRTS